MIITRDWPLYEKVLREVAHPVRQMISGAGDDINFTNLSIRPHPISAIMLIRALKAFKSSDYTGEFARIVEELSNDEDIMLIGVDGRRQNASLRVPVKCSGHIDVIQNKYNCIQSGAFDLNDMAQTQKLIYLIKKNE